MSAGRAKPFFSANTNASWTRYETTGMPKFLNTRGKAGNMIKSAPGQWVIDKPPAIPAAKNVPSSTGGQITSSWIPENAKKKNMRPQHELFNTSDRDGLKLQHTKRLAHVSIPNKIGMPDDIRVVRTIAEELHGQTHIPLLFQQWDPERVDTHPFTKTDVDGQPIPAEPLPDFPRFYDKEMLAELDNWQAKTNESRYNPQTETFIYYHFWAHDNEWVYKRRIDVWDYVKGQAREFLHQRLRNAQNILYGEERTYGKADNVIIRRGDVRVVENREAFVAVECKITCRPLSSRQPPLEGVAIKWRKKDLDASWCETILSSDGTCHVKATIIASQPTEIEVEVQGCSMIFLANPTDGSTASRFKPLTPPHDLVRALPGWHIDEVTQLYRQELMRFEEDLVNTLYNLDAIMHPTPILYACQNELHTMAVSQRINLRQSKKDFDWWFHHQSFCLYLPFYDEQFIHHLQNWSKTLNMKVGNSPWLDSLRQHSPQPVNCLMQVFRKHNSVWDSRVFKVEHDTEGEYAEEHTQEWSFVEHHQEPQPTEEMHLRKLHPAPISDVPPELLDEDVARDETWVQMRSVGDTVHISSTPHDYAEEYFRDTFAARRASGLPPHPDDQPGLEVDPEPDLPAAPAAERKKYVRRIGKLYRKYYNPYNANPQRFVSPNLRGTDVVTDRFW
ncbi:hypothetical protein DIPPA_34825 [Diplonema papillatum]|nr:hypothetical protein DIPPA_34825 [Diplonema papillatum]